MLLSESLNVSNKIVLLFIIDILESKLATCEIRDIDDKNVMDIILTHFRSPPKINFFSFLFK